jgi:hypothetical protein
MENCHAELRAIRLTLEETIENIEILERHGIKMVAIVSDAQGDIGRVPHLERRPRQRLARRNNYKAEALFAYGIKTQIDWVLGHSGIHVNNEANRQANIACEGRGERAIERPYTSAAITASWISEGRSTAKTKWEANKCSQYFGYILKGKAGAKRPIPMTSVKSLAARFYRQWSGHAPTGGYLTQFGHRENDKCWWCGGGGRMAAQMREHLLCHCSRWRDQQKALWKAVGKATGWNVGRC